MDMRMWWLVGGIALLILEMFVGTFDFLALAIAALVTSVIIWMLGITIEDRRLGAFIFLVAAVLAILLTRVLVLPKITGKDAPDPMSGAAVIGTTMVAQEVNKKMVVRYEGVYRSIESTDDVHTGDRVVVEKMKGNHLFVHKA